MSTVPIDTKPAIVAMTFTVKKSLPSNPKLADLDAIRESAADVMAALATQIGKDVTGHITIGKLKFEL